MPDTILYDKKDHIVTITLNRPEALNSINRKLRAELSEAINEIDSDKDTYVGVITGNGRAFCAGRDLKERAQDNADGVQAEAGHSMTKESPYLWPSTYKPLVAAVNGYALAGGWSIAQMCDIRVASEEAQLGISETKWSLLPPFGTILPKHMPLSAVMELVLTAQPVTAQRAYDMGFLNKVVPQDQVLEQAMNYARQIAENAPLAVQAFKELALRGLDMDIPAISTMAFDKYNEILRTEDSKEGPKAFAEKRKPVWQVK